MAGPTRDRNCASCLSVFQCWEHLRGDVMNIIIREKRSGTEVRLSLKKVADLMKLAPEDIEWAIEPSPRGLCDNAKQRKDLAAERNPPRR